MPDDHFQDENSNTHHINDIDAGKRKRTLTEKGKQCRIFSILVKKKKALVSRINRKMSDIDVLMYTDENDIIVKEELQQLNYLFKLIDEMNQEIIELNGNLVKFERKSKSSGKRSKFL